MGNWKGRGIHRAVRCAFPNAHYWAYELEDCEGPVAEEYMEVEG